MGTRLGSFQSDPEGSYVPGEGSRTTPQKLREVRWRTYEVVTRSKWHFRKVAPKFENKLCRLFHPATPFLRIWGKVKFVDSDAATLTQGH